MLAYMLGKCLLAEPSDQFLTSYHPPGTLKGITLLRVESMILNDL